MNDAEKRLHKLAQRDSVMFKRAESMGLQVDHSALEQYIRKNFLNQALDHQEIDTLRVIDLELDLDIDIETPQTPTLKDQIHSTLPHQQDAANHEAPEALSS